MDKEFAKSCEVCGKNFVIIVRHSFDKNRKTCSLKCQSRLFRKTIKKTWDKKAPKIVKKCLYCGKKLRLSKWEIKEKNYCSHSCRAKASLTGKISNNYKNGRYKSNGYIRKLSKKHPQADSDGYIEEHRLVMEKKLGRYLKTNEEVHHKNGVRDDNKIENLKVLSSSEHIRLHKLGNKNWLGKHHTEETKERMRKSWMKRKTVSL